MRMEVNIGTVQTVSPQMITSMTILQCGNQELSEYLEELSYENPLMDLAEPETEAPPEDGFISKLRWLKSFDPQNHSYYAEAEQPGIEQYHRGNQNTSLADHVKEQILTLSVSRQVRSAMETIADLLDQRGLYSGSCQEISVLCGCSPAEAQEALTLIRQLEPAGVAAESVCQALLAQLEPHQLLARRLLEEHYSHLASWSVQRMAKELSVQAEEVTAALEVISDLEPYPSNGFSPQEDIHYITPDLHIYDCNGQLEVLYEDKYTPAVTINGEYLKMLEDEKDHHVQTYLRQKLGQLKQVMEDLSRRRSTVLRCGQVIARHQESFFYGGSLEKLTLRDTARELELHESTVSRAVKNKYIQCERGIFPMSAFFSRDAGQNPGLSRSHIQDILRQIIADEDPSKPFSDEKIVQALAARHISLSRRAVAKYRMELGILPSSARKRK